MRISREELLMSIANLVALRGTCSRLQVGAVFSKQGRVLVQGYNGAPAGLPHCSHTADDDSPCLKSTHAEANGIAFAAKHGIKLADSQLYTTHSPCIPCSHLIINAGVGVVYYVFEFRDISGIDLLKNAGVLTLQFPSTPMMYQDPSPCPVCGPGGCDAGLHG